MDGAVTGATAYGVKKGLDKVFGHPEPAPKDGPPAKPDSAE